jgi:hypothetical protein
MAYFKNRRPASIVNSGRHTQVPLRFFHAAVAEVRGEMRQQPLHVLPLAVPTHQAIHRERVAKVVQS